MFTGYWIQKVLIRDSDHLVKPFMHVTIQMTRHYATLSFLTSITRRVGL